MVCRDNSIYLSSAVIVSLNAAMKRNKIKCLGWNEGSRRPSLATWPDLPFCIWLQWWRVLGWGEMVLVICTEVGWATAPPDKLTGRGQDCWHSSLSVLPFWLQLRLWRDCRVTSSCAGPSQAWESVPVVVPEAALESAYLCSSQGTGGAWQRPCLTPTMHLGTETGQGMRMAPEPVILALQT